MQWVQFLDGFEFQQQYARDDEVHAVAAIELRTLVDQRERHLAFVGDTHRQQFQMQRPLVVRLIQPRSKLSMHRHGSSDHLPGQIRAEIFMLGFHT